MQETGAEIAMIKKSLKKIKFDAEMSVIKGHEEQIGPYRSNSLKHLIKECDKNAREMRKNAHRKEQKKS